MRPMRSLGWMCQVALRTMVLAPNSKVTFCSPANMGANVLQTDCNPTRRDCLGLHIYQAQKDATGILAEGPSLDMGGKWVTFRKTHFPLFHYLCQNSPYEE